LTLSAKLRTRWPDISVAVVAVAGFWLIWSQYSNLSALSWWYEGTVRFREGRDLPAADYDLTTLPWQLARPQAFEVNQGTLALVTNTQRALADRALNSIGHQYFSATVCGDEVPRGKPAPDAYLRAAALLDLPPDLCLAIEDSVTGTAAAERAGCPVLVVPNDVAVPMGPRRRHVHSLANVDVADLRRVYAELTQFGERTA